MYFAEFIGTSIRESFPATLETELPAVDLDVLLTGQTRELPSIRYGDENIPKSEFELKVFPIERQTLGVCYENITSLATDRTTT